MLTCRESTNGVYVLLFHPDAMTFDNLTSGFPLPCFHNSDAMCSFDDLINGLSPCCFLHADVMSSDYLMNGFPQIWCLLILEKIEVLAICQCKGIGEGDLAQLGHAWRKASSFSFRWLPIIGAVLMLFPQFLATLPRAWQTTRERSMLMERDAQVLDLKLLLLHI